MRERGEDILLLIDHFLGIYAEENQFDRPKLSKEAFDILKEYSWPGNIRELRNFCENLVVLKRGDEITPYDLDPRFTMQESGQDTPEQATAHTLSVEENEKKASQKCLGQSQRESHEGCRTDGDKPQNAPSQIVQMA